MPRRGASVPVSCQSGDDRFGALPTSYGAAMPAPPPPPPSLVRPVVAGVASTFTYDRATPFAPGRRRVLRLQPTRDQAVRAPCTGRVTFAGATPGGTAVAVRCGRWTVAVTGLRVTIRGRGARVRAGGAIGRSSSAPIGLSLRPAGDVFGYVDPAPRLRAPVSDRRFTPLGPSPRSRSPLSSARAAASVGVRFPSPVAVASPVRTGAGATAGPRVEGVTTVPTSSVTPGLVWGGLGLAALGLPVGARRGRRRARVSTGRRIAAGGRTVGVPGTHGGGLR